MAHFLQIVLIQLFLFNFKCKSFLYLMKFAIPKFQQLKRKLVLNTDIFSLFIYVIGFCILSHCSGVTNTRFVDTGKMKFVE